MGMTFAFQSFCFRTKSFAKEGKMTFSLNNSVSANNIFRNINLTHSLLIKSMEKLASGLRINRASDDPAGLVISEQMRSRIASLNQEIENVTVQINRYETGSSATLQLREMLTEMRSLAIAASNEGVNNSSMQAAYQAEANRLVDTYNFVVENTAFGTQELLDGSEGSLTTVPTLDYVDLSDAQSAEEAIERIDEEISRLDQTIAQLGATQKNDLESRLTNLRVESQNLTAAESQIRDTDFAMEFSTMLKNELLLHSSVSLLAHSFVTPQSVLGLLIGSNALRG
jgi:flagellin